MPPKIPKTLGRYEILEELGRGAMGVVYLARDPLIGRLVALKTFQSGYNEGDRELVEFRARFLREAQSAGILNHPAIVTIHDVVDSSAEEGATFIAMEYVQGTNLKDRLQSVGRLEIRRAIRIILQIADGLDYAHDSGVVHRDIKPANIILTREGNPKITDFGIARLDTSDLTQEGQLLGTPNYMAPERILGREVDHRTDIFSLGVLLYEMLTCHKPFQGDNLTMVTHRIVYEPFAPPEKYDPSIPPGIVAILERAMQKEPGDRYSRAGEMAADLRAVLASLPEVEAESGAQRHLAETQDVSGQLELEAVQAAVGEATRDQPLPGPPPGSSRAASLRPSWLASALRVGIVALLFLIPMALAWGWVSNRQPPVERPSTEALARAHSRPMLQAARSAIDRGRPDLAVGHLDRAQEIAPTAPALARLRAEVEAALGDRARRAAERERSAWLAAARQALEKGDLDGARADAERLLQATPEDPDALAVIADVEAETARRRAARQARAAAPPPEPPPVVVDETPMAVPTAAEFPMAITFFTEVSRGTMMVWVNDRLILNEAFKFVERVGFLKTEDRHGRIDATTVVATGPVEVRVEVDPRGGAQVTGSYTGVVQDGEQRVLEIRFDAAERLSIGLRTGEVSPVTEP